MCGIMGYIGGGNAVQIVYNGLKRLEYRGYDSAGVAFVSDEKLVVVKKRGRVEKLLPHLSGMRSGLGIGHTRWATHGSPSDKNAHPHVSGKIAVVHNGIIENCGILRGQLEKEGVKFLSDTDSEIIAHLINKYYSGNLKEAVARAISHLSGSYALMAICQGEQKIVVARYKSPLIIGYGEGENYCASDEPALAGKCDLVSFLEDGDIAEITEGGVEIYDGSLNAVSRKIHPNLAVSNELGLGDYPHYMLKELRETPYSVRATLRAFESVKDKLSDCLKDVNRVIFVGCGTAYHAALVGVRYVETFARIPASVETAGEFRYKKPVMDKKTAVFAVSQSGETADTVEAARLAVELGAKVIAVTNSLRSHITRIAQIVVPVAAGTEICVAATKSYTGQVTALYLSALTLAGKPIDESALLNAANSCEEVVKNIEIGTLAHRCSRARGVYFLGRDIDYTVALEGSLKLKEVSYVPGEGYPAGELKHGTLALIDKRTVCVFLITDEELADKSVNAVEQVLSRGGQVAVFTDISRIADRVSGKTKFIYRLPDCGRLLSPLVTSAAMFKLAYYTAVSLRRDPDKPRNLAKSVTTE